MLIATAFSLVTFLFVVIQSKYATEKLIQLNRLLTVPQCKRIIDDVHLSELLDYSIRRQLPQLHFLISADLPNDLGSVNYNTQYNSLHRLLNRHESVSSAVIFDVPISNDTKILSIFSNQNDSGHQVDERRNAADSTMISLWMSLDESETAYFIEPNCTRKGQWLSWMVVVKISVPLKRHEKLVASSNLKDEQLVYDEKTRSRVLLLRIGQGNLDLDVCNEALELTRCRQPLYRCESMPGIGLRLDGYRCCCNSSSGEMCTREGIMMSGQETNGTGLECPSRIAPGLRNTLLIINLICAFLSLLTISVVIRQRRTQQYGARGWALMELFLVGAALLYSIVAAEWLTPSEAWSCCLAVWLRELGFITFYGAVVLKIYRNLQEYRVRKAHHVYVKEQDLIKYMAALIALTVTGLLGWTLGAVQADNSLLHRSPPLCRLQVWAVAWQVYELLFLLYGIRLCYKARNSTWIERWQFTVVVCLETLVTLTSNFIRYSIRHSTHPDTPLTISFVQVHLTVTINIFLIMTPKFYFLSQDERNRRTLTIAGSSARAHPSLAKLRDNLVNGTIDFAEVPIADMNPEDIRAELKRVYTQLRMYKLKNIYQDNPHISKRKGGKKSSDKEKLAKNRRISIPPTSPQTKARDLIRVEEDEKSSMMGAEQVTAAACSEEGPVSDLTVESSPHNVYLAHAASHSLEPPQSVRV